ncbi:MAG TPA: nucleotide-binding protein [Rhizomicrobium sp.]|nr:nucleotide-binding protein [Rhizomicrobium sp.]
MLDRHLAALVLASENGIGVHRYSSAEERAEIRGAHVGTPVAAPPAAGARPTRSQRPIGSAIRKQRSRTAKDNSVFVVHGRNDALRRSMFDFLRSVGLNPLEWEKAVLKAKGANPYVGDILSAAMEQVQAIVVLLSPDDDAKLKDEFCKPFEKRSEGKLQGQARPNVLFEAGWAIGRYPLKTVLVQIGRQKEFSDVGGRHMVRLTNDAAKRTDFVNRLEKIGCKPERHGADWLTTGDFKA